VVGVDGSSNSAVAFAWAVEEACRHGGQIRLVAAWHHSRLGNGSLDPLPGLRQQHAESVAQRILEQVPHAAVDVRVEIVEGLASAVLVELATDADLLVVGTLGVEAGRRVVLGSVSARCAMRASCPVVVVPPSWRGPGLHELTCLSATQIPGAKS
jgi:nucleotide-binding universal stress UspA family protein